MKKIYSIILTAVAALAIAPAAGAQYTINDFIKGKYGNTAQLQFPNDNGVQFPEGKDFAYSKNISKPFSDGTYYIKLESFALGSAELVDKPSDIILVLDVSGSMSSNYGTDTSTDLYPYGFASSTFNYNGISYSQIQSGTYSGSKYRYNGQFYTVKGLRTGTSSSNYRYFLYFDEVEGDSSTRHWLWEDKVVDTQPAGVTGQTTAIFWDRLWRDKRKSKMDALKEAVSAFISIIDENDQYATAADGTLVPRLDPENNPTRLGNRISIVKFANPAYYSNNHLAEGNHRGKNGSSAIANNTANYTELVKNVTLLGDGGKDALTDAVDGLVEGSQTAADIGLTIANEVLNQATVKNRDSNKIIVFFTDGEPNHSDGFDDTVANAAIVQAAKAKDTYDATIFAVGVFGSSVSSKVKPYMNRVSSNYTGSTTYQNGRQVSDKYYKLGNENLVEVFADIARQAGGSEASLTASTSNVDIVSNSFILPDGVTSSNIENYVKVFTAPLTYCDTETNTYTFGTETLAGHATDTYDVLDEDGNVTGTYKVDEVPNPSGTTPATVGIHVGLENDNAIKVTNFDYTNNWCGPIENAAHQTTYHGHKIIILIPIQMNPDAVGGPNVETNAEGSGIFAKEGDTFAFVEFQSPTVSLPVNLFIEKDGLEGVESAKFLIERAIIPDTENWTVDDIADDAWEYVSTVFVTNSENAKHNTETNNPWVKVRGLPATKAVEVGSETVQKGLIYRISEEKWSWSYNPKGNKYQYTATGKVENPFLFENEKKDNGQIDVTIRHAESKVTNKFTNVTTKEVYDDSKTNDRTSSTTNP